MKEHLTQESSCVGSVCPASQEEREGEKRNKDCRVGLRLCILDIAKRKEGGHCYYDKDWTLNALH
jgi:hypothetical protein